MKGLLCNVPYATFILKGVIHYLLDIQQCHWIVIVVIIDAKIQVHCMAT